jgi:hypothetical protein
MTANKRTFEVDRFLTRELLLHRDDNTFPPANQVILTDGRGGTYFRDINPSTATTGFNRITLSDSGSTFNAPLPFNNLNIKQGLGVSIAKQTINGHEYLTFQMASPIPSTFCAVGTQNGILYADGASTILNLIGKGGIATSVSSNILCIDGSPGFAAIILSTPMGTVTMDPEQSSTLTIQAGFGISLVKTTSGSFSMATTMSSYALNGIYVQGQTPVKFRQPNNIVQFVPAGGTYINVSSNQLTFGSNTFSRLVLPSGSTIESSTSNYSLLLCPGYGVNYLKVNSSLQIFINPSFNIISTPNGTIKANNNNILNTLSFVGGKGIEYEVSSQAITLKFASSIISFIETECGTISSNKGTAYFRQGKGIVLSTSADNMLYINSKDYNRFNIIDGTTNLITTSIFATMQNKSISFIQGPGIQMIGNTNTNTVSFQAISSIYVSGPQYAFSYLQIYSTASYMGQDLTSFELTQTINSAPQGQSNLGFVPVSPVSMQTDVANKLVYVGLDISTLLQTTNEAIDNLTFVVSSLNYDPLNNSITLSSINLHTASTQTLDISSITVLGSLFVGTTGLNETPILITTVLSSFYLETATLFTSTIGTATNQLMQFDYVNSQIGINLQNIAPQATLHVDGTVLAQSFASYSDSSLKKFISEFRIHTNDLSTLKPWNFNWLADNQTDVGFAAEDVEKVLPSAVKKTVDGLKMVDYGRLSVVSIAALRDTNNRLQAVESTLTSLLSKFG